MPGRRENFAGQLTEICDDYNVHERDDPWWDSLIQEVVLSARPDQAPQPSDHVLTLLGAHRLSPSDLEAGETVFQTLLSTETVLRVLVGPCVFGCIP